MPKLTVTNLTAVPVGTPAYQLSDVSIQDPFPAEGRMVLTVPAGATKSAIVEMGQLQRVKPQLIDFQQKGIISWSSEATDEDPRAEDADLMGGPELTILDTGTTPITAAAANVGCVGYGANLLMGMVQAKRRLVDPVTPLTDYIDVVAIDPGIAGNEIGVAIISNPGVIDPSGVVYVDLLPVPAGYSRVLQIHFNPAVLTTWALLGAVLNDVVNGIYPRTLVMPAGPFRLQAALFAGANVPVDNALGLLVGGIGVPLMLSVGNVSAVITLLWNHTVQYDVDLTASPMAKGDSVIVRIRASGGGPSALAGTGLA